MAERKTVIVDLKLETGAYLKNVVDAKAKVGELKAANLALKASIEQAAAAGENLDDLNVALAANEAALRDANTELKQYEKQVDNATKANKAAAGSYEELYRQYVDAEIRLKTLADTVQRNADGTIELTDEYKAASDEVRRLKDGLLEFNAGIKDGRLNVGNYSQAIEGAIGKLGGLGKSLGPAGQSLVAVSEGFEAVKSAAGGLKENVTGFGESLKSAGGLGANAMKLLRTGIISTGIGALVVLVGSLVAYFTKTLDGSRQIKVAFAAIGGAVNNLLQFLGKLGGQLIGVFTSPIETGKKVIDYLNNTYVKAWLGIGKVLKGVFTLDPQAIKEGADQVGKAVSNAVAPVKAVAAGFKEAGASAVQAAKDAADLEKRTQKVAQLKRESAAQDVKDKSAAENLVKLAEDRSLSEEQRIQALRDAAALEQQVEARRLKIAEETLAIKREELRINGASEELLNDIAAQEAEVATIKAETAGKVADANIKERTLQRDFAAQRAAFLVAEAQAELALLQAKGEDTVAIRKRIADEERKAALAALSEGTASREAIEKAYQAKVLAIEQETENAREAVRRSAFDKQVELFGDSKEKELAIAAETLRRELADFDKRTTKTADDAKLREAIVQENANRLLQIEQNYQAQSQQRQAEAAQRALDQTTRNIDAEATLKRQQLELRLAAIDAKPVEQRTAAELEFQRQAAAESVAIEQARLQAILAAQVAAQAARQANEEAAYQAQRTRTEEQLRAAGVAEDAIKVQLATIDKARADQRVKTEQETSAAIQGTQAALNQALVDGEKTRTEQTGALLALQRQGARENVDALQSTLKEVAGILAQDEKSRKKYAAVLKALGVAEITFNLYKEIAGYWAGAGSDSAKSVIGGIPATILAGIRTGLAIIRAGAGIQAINAQKFASGGMTNLGEVVNQYQPRLAPGFAGGYVNGPTLWPGRGRFNLAGEAGPEYVTPTWQLRQAPGLFAALETWRTTGVRPFADGGLTAAAITQPLLNTANAIEDAVARGYMKAPAPVVAVTEINDVSNRVAVIESRANL